jgi:hypothetical protein
VDDPEHAAEYCAMYAQFMTLKEMRDWVGERHYFRVFDDMKDVRTVTRILDGEDGEDVPWFLYENGVMVDEFT